MKRKIRRRCACGCGEITNYGKQYVHGHHGRGKKHSAETIKKMSEAAKNRSAEARLNISLARQGNTNSLGHKHTAKTKKKMSLALQYRVVSAETKLKMSLVKLKLHPKDEYCDIWRDGEYRKDIRKNYCENIDCKKDYKQLCNHHIYLDKKKCAPDDIMTMCGSCHMILHNKLRRGILKAANPKDFIIINRPNHVSYVHKKPREIIKIIKREMQG